MLVTFPLDRIETAAPQALSDELEKGNIVFFPESPVPLPSYTDMDFLRREMPPLLESKNVSFHHETRKITGLSNNSETSNRTSSILQEHSRNVQAFLHRIMPTLTQDWTVGTSSFRPLEEKGRHLRAHASNELVHVDAGAYGATHGDRVLRFFVNINPERDRVWITKGTFPDLYRRFGKQAEIDASSPRSLSDHGIKMLYSKLLAAAANAGFRQGRLIDSSPYDRLMRRFHNYMKDTPEFQAVKEGHEEFHFPPFSAWMVFTDMVSHACIEGQFAFVDTFIVPLQNCHLPEFAPMNILKFPSGAKTT